MRVAPLLAALLLAPTAWAQTVRTQPVEAPGAERPPERPSAGPSSPAPPTRSGGEERPSGARPPEPPHAEAPAAAESPEPQGAPEPPEPAVPPGPPQPERLRESDVDFSACLLALHVMGARYEAGGAIVGEQRDCGIARPVTLAEALPGLALEGAPAMRCETARALGWWLRDHVIPAAARLPGAPRPVALALGTTYQCRGVVGGGDEAPKLSEHAFGNALDLAAIRFDAGEPLALAESGGSDLRAAFLAAIRGTACLYFTTVLGPGSNAAHGDHLHLDMKERRGGFRICE